MDEPLYFVLHYYRIYSKTGGKQIRTHGAGACQRLLSTNKNSTGACEVKHPSGCQGLTSLAFTLPVPGRPRGPLYLHSVSEFFW